MLDDLMFSEEEVNEVQNPTQPSTQGYNQQRNNYSGGNNNNSGGGYQRKGGWTPKEEVIEEPYSPITVYIDREFPQEIKDKLVAIASRLINKGYTVRFNADDKDISDPIMNISQDKVEAHTPWRNFNEINSKHYWNSKTSTHLASTNFPAWDKIPNVVQAMMARNVRMIFGTRNNSITKCLITWSPDGASKFSEVTRDTGRSSFIISFASKYCFPVINIQKEGAISAMEKALDL